MFRQILHSYWPTRHDSASLHPPEPLPPSFSHLLGLSARILLSSSALDADFMQFGTLKMIFLEQALTHLAISVLHRIPPLLWLSSGPCPPTTTAAVLFFSQGDHGSVFRFVNAFKDAHFKYTHFFRNEIAESLKYTHFFKNEIA
jgi:hypothetical protein